jgi:NAD(P)-dependent dehydrogenase (short-subunit alcohol dehydrogenase family)
MSTDMFELGEKVVMIPVDSDGLGSALAMGVCRAGARVAATLR